VNSHLKEGRDFSDYISGIRFQKPSITTKILSENNWYKDGDSDFAPVGYKCRMSLPSQLIQCQLYLEILLSVAIKCVPRKQRTPVSWKV